MAGYFARGHKSLDNLSPRAMENGNAHALPNRTPTSPTTVQEHQALAVGDRDPLQKNQDVPVEQHEHETEPEPESEPEPLRTRLSWRTVIQSVRQTVNPRKQNPKLADIATSPDFHEIIKENRRAEPLAGYPELARIIGRDERWFIYRRFNQLQTRLILEKQDELRLIEEDLHDADLNDSADTRVDKDETGHRVRVAGGKLFTRHRRNPQEAKERRKLFAKAERVYKEYTELLTAANHLAKLDKPAKHEWQSVQRYVYQAKPIVEREAAYIQREMNELVTLRKEREHAVFDALFESGINYLKNSKWSRGNANDSGGSGKVEEFLQANASAGKAANFINMVFLSALVPFLFVIPIYVLSLHHVQHSIGASIGVLIAFAIAFTSVLAVGTPAKAHEIWSCAAAYLAVLVVFLGGITRSKGAQNG